MRQMIVLLFAVVLVGMLASGAMADDLRGKIKIPYGTVVTDTMKWRASGAIPGTGPKTVDTLIGATLNDTTLPFDIYGAQEVYVSLLGRSLNDDLDYTMTFQVSQNSDTLAMWHSLATTYAVDVTAGAAVGQSDNTGRDTTLIGFLSNEPRFGATHDPSAALTLAAEAGNGMTLMEYGDRIAVRGSRYLRMWFDADSATSDTNFITAVITVVYPPGPQ